MLPFETIGSSVALTRNTDVIYNVLDTYTTAYNVTASTEATLLFEH